MPSLMIDRGRCFSSRPCSGGFPISRNSAANCESKIECSTSPRTQFAFARDFARHRLRLEFLTVPAYAESSNSGLRTGDFSRLS